VCSSDLFVDLAVPQPPLRVVEMVPELPLRLGTKALEDEGATSMGRNDEAFSHELPPAGEEEWRSATPFLSDRADGTLPQVGARGLRGPRNSRHAGARAPRRSRACGRWRWSRWGHRRSDHGAGRE